MSTMNEWSLRSKGVGFKSPPAWISFAFLVASIGVSIYFALAQLKEDRRQKYLEFEAKVERAEIAIRNRMDKYQQVLKGGLGLFYASNDVSRHEWRRYVATLGLEQSFPGIQGVGYSQFIRPDELEGHQSELRQTGFPDYVVRPPGPRALYSSIIYLEPFTGRNLSAFGYDMYSEPTRRAAMEQARDSGEAKLSGRVTLVQETHGKVQAGTLLYVPVYRTGNVPNDEETRKSEIQGFVYAPFRMDDLVKGIFGQNREIDLKIYDGTIIEAVHLLHDSLDGAVADMDLARQSRVINVAGRDWKILYFDRPSRTNATSWLPLFYLIAGPAIGFLLFFLIRSLSRTRDLALEYAEEMTDAYRRTENLNQRILENAQDAIITFDSSGNILSLNQAAIHISGFSIQSGQKLKLSQLLPELGLQKQQRSGLFEQRLKKSTGEMVPIELSISNISGGNLSEDDQKLSVVIIRDMTERAKLDQIKREFISVVSHELRTPLTSISGSLQLIASGVAGELPNMARELIAIATKNCDRLVRLINDILDLEKVESGQIDFHVKTLDLVPLCEEAIAAITGFADSFEVKVVLQNAPKQAWIKVDRDRFLQVMANLLSNAVKFSPAGGAVAVAIEEYHQNWRIAVADRGPGIPQEFLPRLFSKFAQADSSDTRPKGGTGLGLAIVKLLLDQMNGQISVDTHLERGTIFFVDLPQEIPEEVSSSLP